MFTLITQPMNIMSMQQQFILQQQQQYLLQQQQQHLQQNEQQSDQIQDEDQRDKQSQNISNNNSQLVIRKKQVKVIEKHRMSIDELIRKQILEPNKVINPYLHYRIGDDTYISEDCLSDMENKSILNVYNTFKKIDYLTKDKYNSVHLYFKDKTEVQFPPWQYVAQRFESFGQIEYKDLANAVKVYGNFIQEQQEKASRKGSMFDHIDIQASTKADPFYSAPSPSETSDIKDSVLIENYFSQNQDKPMMVFRKIIKDGISTFRSMHFNKKFMNDLNWDPEEFQMDALFNGVPEILGNKFYRQNVVRTLSHLKDLIEKKANQLPPPQDSNMELISKQGVCRDAKVLFSILPISDDSQTFVLQVVDQVENGFMIDKNKQKIKRKPQIEFTDLEKECISQAFSLIDPADLASNKAKTCKVKVIPPEKRSTHSNNNIPIFSTNF